MYSCKNSGWKTYFFGGGLGHLWSIFHQMYVTLGLWGVNEKRNLANLFRI